MEKQIKRPSIREINDEMDAIMKRKPTKQQIEELGEVIRKINKENEATAHEDLQKFYESEVCQKRASTD